MQGKRGLIAGVANDMSLAAWTARTMKDAGANIVIIYQPTPAYKKRALAFAESIKLDPSHVLGCDVTIPGETARCFASVAEIFGGELDFFVHSIGGTDPKYIKVPFIEVLASPELRETFLKTMDISVLSFLNMSYRARELMKKKKNGSIMTFTYEAANLAIEFYNLMAVAKGGLEACVPALALAFGEDNIRVNCISASPEKTLSGLAVGNAYKLGSSEEGMSPFGRRATHQEIANEALYLASDLSTAITGQNRYVNCGRNSVGAAPVRNREQVLRGLGLDPFEVDCPHDSRGDE